MSAAPDALAAVVDVILLILRAKLTCIPTDLRDTLSLWIRNPHSTRGN